MWIIEFLAIATFSSAFLCWQAKPAKKMCVMLLPSMTMQLRGHRNWISVRMSGTFCWMTQNIGGVCRMPAIRQAMFPATMSKRRNLPCLTGNISSISLVTVTRLLCSHSVLTYLLTSVVILARFKRNIFSCMLTYFHICPTDLNLVSG